MKWGRVSCTTGDKKIFSTDLFIATSWPLCRHAIWVFRVPHVKRGIKHEGLNLLVRKREMRCCSAMLGLACCVVNDGFRRICASQSNNLLFLKISSFEKHKLISLFSFHCLISIWIESIFTQQMRGFYLLLELFWRKLLSPDQTLCFTERFVCAVQHVVRKTLRLDIT